MGLAFRPMPTDDCGPYRTGQAGPYAHRPPWSSRSTPQRKAQRLPRPLPRIIDDSRFYPSAALVFNPRERRYYSKFSDLKGTTNLYPADTVPAVKSRPARVMRETLAVSGCTFRYSRNALRCFAINAVCGPRLTPDGRVMLGLSLLQMAELYSAYPAIRGHKKTLATRAHRRLWKA